MEINKGPLFFVVLLPDLNGNERMEINGSKVFHI